ncbi:MAG: peptidoglycan DD-metalloendopeptidase family protein [Nitrospirota bacterium]
MIGAAILCGGLFGAEAAAQAKGGKSDPKKELEQLQRQLEQKKQQQKSAARKEQSILEELEGIDRRIQLNRRRIAEMDRRVRRQDEERERLDAEVRALEQSVAALRQAVAGRLRAAYMAGEAGGWGVLLGADTYLDARARVDALQRIAAREAALLDDYRRQRGELTAKLQAEQALLADVRRNRDELASALDDIGRARANKRTLLTKIRTEQSTASKAIAELEQASKQLQELLKRLEQQEKQRKADGRLAQAKGKLPWPQEGEVVGLFGRQRHPQYNTDVFRRGIEIRSSEGAPVKAVHQAVVAYADWFKGFGLVVVLDHGDHYYTLYAHLGKSAVKVGEAVERGQVIGEVGGTGMGSETTLYFEVRHHGTPLDPIGWLKKRGKG